jgi:hypothetical protein
VETGAAAALGVFDEFTAAAARPGCRRGDDRRWRVEEADEGIPVVAGKERRFEKAIRAAPELLPGSALQFA